MATEVTVSVTVRLKDEKVLKNMMEENDLVVDMSSEREIYESATIYAVEVTRRNFREAIESWIASPHAYGVWTKTSVTINDTPDEVVR